MTQAKKTAEEMYPLIERYLNGQQTQKAFCREHALSLSRLNYWLAKYRRQAALRPDAFVELTPVGPPAERALLEVVYPQGIRLRLFEPVEPAYLASLLRLDTSAA